MRGVKKTTSDILTRKLRLEFDLLRGSGRASLKVDIRQRDTFNDGLSIKGIATPTTLRSPNFSFPKELSPGPFSFLDRLLQDIGAAYFQLLYGFSMFADGHSTTLGFTRKERDEIYRGLADFGRVIDIKDYERSGIRGRDELETAIDTGDINQIAFLLYSTFLRIVGKTLEKVENVWTLGDKGKTYLQIIGEEAFSEAAALHRGLSNANVIKQFLNRNYPDFAGQFTKLSELVHMIIESLYNSIIDTVAGDTKRATEVLRLLMDGRYNDFRRIVQDGEEGSIFLKDVKSYETSATPPPKLQAQLESGKKLSNKEISLSYMGLTIRSRIEKNDADTLKAALDSAPAIIIMMIYSLLREGETKPAIALAISFDLWPKALTDTVKAQYITEMEYDLNDLRWVLNNENLMELANLIYKRYSLERIGISGGPERVSKEAIYNYVRKIKSPLVYLALYEIFSDKKAKTFPQSLVRVIRDPANFPFFVIDLVDTHIGKPAD